ncbi:thioredoxin family protein [Calothrix sp. NIES-3974]|uniref:thioredoxin family protein n=1 Tax=Calothrix sp. NIES-3974 TaxID=2005462 RepID=UPI000B61C8AB|nr:thioredoxin family protein [Calothrix sp. NIES-3974]BAZ05929.1 alkyl hydroperoxide reductase/ thiol specific antioxidant/ Mal allergen [Calothrix sp. NIES-3974]
MKTLEMLNNPIGNYAPDFELPGIDGQVHHLSRYLEKFRAIAVISMANTCPYVDLYIDRLKSLQSQFCHQNVTLVGLNSTDVGEDAHTTVKMMEKFAQERQLNFPYLWDSTQDVMRSFGGTATPTAFLIDSNGIVRYRGQIDDHPQGVGGVKQPYLHNAIASLIAGKVIEITETEVIGTNIIWRN